MGVGGIFLKFGGTVARFLQICSAVIIVGIFAYFVRNNRQTGYKFPNTWSAVLGIASAAAIYTLAGVFFTICLGGSALFGNLAILLDILFVGAFAYVAYATRGGAGRCRGFVYTPLGSGPANQGTGNFIVDDLRSACRYNRVAFAFAIILIFLFLISAIWQFFMVRRRSTEKRRHVSKV